jgi:hypothetical protein
MGDTITLGPEKHQIAELDTVVWHFPTHSVLLCRLTGKIRAVKAFVDFGGESRAVQTFLPFGGPCVWLPQIALQNKTEVVNPRLVGSTSCGRIAGLLLYRGYGEQAA